MGPGSAARLAAAHGSSVRHKVALSRTWRLRAAWGVSGVMERLRAPYSGFGQHMAAPGNMGHLWAQRWLWATWGTSGRHRAADDGGAETEAAGKSGHLAAS